MPVTKGIPQGFTTIGKAARDHGHSPSKLCTLALQGAIKYVTLPGGRVCIETASVEALDRALNCGPIPFMPA
jgi:hypothetical protein